MTTRQTSGHDFHVIRRMKNPDELRMRYPNTLYAQMNDPIQ